jgi:small subunit ribosomal protein S16
VSVKIRLKRIGRKKQPSYRIVIAESRNARGGEVIETIGSYTPYKKDKPLEVDMVRVEDWTRKGAVPTESVKRLLRQVRRGVSPAAEKKAVKVEIPAIPAPEPEATAPEVS